MTPSPDRDAVLAALEAIPDPKSGKGLFSAGLVKGLILGEGRAGFMLEVAAADAALYAPVRDAAEAALSQVAGVRRAQIILTAAVDGARPAGPPSRAGARVATDPKAEVNAMPPAEPLAHVKRVVAVASGKGGVGKSTVAVSLACALAAQGLSVGLLDADVYGPSIPRMMGAAAKPRFEDGKLIPLEAFDVKMMSIGFLVDEGSPMIWRGPMASSAMRQMIQDVRWGTKDDPLDILIVDLPPGTGDIHLTLIQKLTLDGVVLVSTPQEIALIDARRACAMFGKMTPPVPILGVIENMAFFPDPTTGAPIPIFGQGGARAEAIRLGVPFLGEVPIDIGLREGGDAGRPLVAADPQGGVAKAFAAMARRLMS